MNKKIYDDGTLKVEQVVAKENIKPTVKTMAVKSAVGKNVSCAELIDTAFSYGNAGLEVLEYGKGHECALCGSKTSYANRYICPSCWSKYKSEILKSLKDKIGKANIEVK